MAKKKSPKTNARRNNLKTAVKPILAADDIFCSPDNTPSQVVLVDAKLKKLASAFIDAWRQCDHDFIDQELPDLCARFLRTEDAAKALQQVKSFADYVFKKKAASLKLLKQVTNENLQLPARIILPEIFSWPAADIADSTNDHDVKRGCDVEAAKLYLAIFTGTDFKRLVLADPGSMSKERKQLLANVQAAQECLVAYLKSMVKQARQHIVKIGEDISIEIDGKTVETKGAAKRALLSLALMHGKSKFSTTEFSLIYYGANRTAGDAASEFTTAIRDAKKLVRNLSYESDNKGNRSVSGIYFVVQAADAQLKQAIAGLLAAEK